MKRYFAFGAPHYEEQGGWDDFLDSFDTVDEAAAFLRSTANIDWWHVIDGTTGKQVASWTRPLVNP